MKNCLKLLYLGAQPPSSCRVTSLLTFLPSPPPASAQQQQAQSAPFTQQTGIQQPQLLCYFCYPKLCLVPDPHLVAALHPARGPQATAALLTANQGLTASPASSESVCHFGHKFLSYFNVATTPTGFPSGGRPSWWVWVTAGFEPLTVGLELNQLQLNPSRCN